MTVTLEELENHLDRMKLAGMEGTTKWKDQLKLIDRAKREQEKADGQQTVA